MSSKRNVQGLILAAGYGKRLKPLTNELPKAMIEINGTPLIINALNQIYEAGIKEVIIVVGHMKSKIINKIGSDYKGINIIYIENPYYLLTNNIYSLYLTKNYIKSDVVLIECDLFYSENLINKIIEKDNEDADCNIMVSSYDKDAMDGTVVQVDAQNNVIKLFTKSQQTGNFNYKNTLKTVNIYKFKKDYILKKLLPAIECYISSYDANCYYEFVLGSLIYYNNDKIKVIKVDKSEWAEIDDIEDLRKAKLQFRSNTSNF
jgi:NDP-sugar pyrophosphorylase family protein